MSEKEEKQARYIEKLTQAQIKLIEENEQLENLNEENKGGKRKWQRK